MGLFKRRTKVIVQEPKPKKYPHKSKSGKQYFCECCGKPMQIMREQKYYDKRTGKLTRTLVEAQCKDYNQFAGYVFGNGNLNHTIETFTEKRK